MSSYIKNKSIGQEKLNLSKPTSNDLTSGATVDYVTDVYKSIMGNSALTNLNTENNDSLVSAVNEINNNKLDNYVEYNKTIIGDSGNTPIFIDLIPEWVSTNTTQEVGQKRYNYTQVDMMYQSGIDVYVDSYYITSQISIRTVANTLIIPSSTTTRYFIPYRIDGYINLLGTYTSGIPVLNIGITSPNYTDIVSGATLNTITANRLYNFSLINTSRINITNGLYVRISGVEVGSGSANTITLILKGLIQTS